MADLEGIAHLKGVAIIEVERLRHKGWAEYDHRTQVIRVKRGLGVVQWRSVVAHELGHHFYGHTRHRRRYEAQADRYAAWLLIHPDDWARATAVHPDCPQAVAAELGVMPRLVEVYATELTRHADGRNRKD